MSIGTVAQDDLDAGGTRAPVVTMEGVDVRFTTSNQRRASRKAVSGVDLEIADGELVVIVGQSGCGKTTILNVLAGLVDVAAGSVRIANQSPLAARHLLSYMFARDALLPWRTARRNVELAIEAREPNVSRRDRRRRAQAMLEQLGVGESASLSPWQLSQGMRQRVALARTWVVSPRLMLMDEPFAALDAQTRTSAQEQFLDVWMRDRRTIVFVTHDLREAVLIADRVIVMESGRIVGELPVTFPRPRRLKSLEEDPEFRAAHRLLDAMIHGTEGAR